MINDLTGKKFGRLTVLGDSGERDSQQRVAWKCLCECGRECLAIGYQLRFGIKKSCGCIRQEHGHNLGKKNSSRVKTFTSDMRSNSNTGYRGVVFSAAHGNVYIARICVDGKPRYLCISHDLSECIQERRAAEQALTDGTFDEYYKELQARRKKITKSRRRNSRKKASAKSTQ